MRLSSGLLRSANQKPTKRKNNEAQNVLEKAKQTAQLNDIKGIKYQIIETIKLKILLNSHIYCVSFVK
jgi:hypothetical protein